MLFDVDVIHVISKQWKFRLRVFELLNSVLKLNCVWKWKIKSLLSKVKETNQQSSQIYFLQTRSLMFLNDKQSFFKNITKELTSFFGGRICWHFDRKLWRRGCDFWELEVVEEGWWFFRRGSGGGVGGSSEWEVEEIVNVFAVSIWIVHGLSCEKWKGEF